jgi:hypothetical protein
MSETVLIQRTGTKDRYAQGVVLLDAETGDPYTASGGTGVATGDLTDTQLRATPVPVSGVLTDTQLRASSVATEPLGTPSVARQLTAAATSANTALTATCRRISIKARTSDIRYAIGATAQTAVATTSHFIEAGERLDLAVPASANIAVIRDTSATSDGILCVTELA